MNATPWRKNDNESSLINASFTQTVDFEKEIVRQKKIFFFLKYIIIAFFF